MARRQKTLWVRINEATREQMALSLAQRREAIARELGQMAVDCDSYNQNWNRGEPIGIVFDFTNDVAEFKLMAMERARERLARGTVQPIRKVQ